jgi:RNA polymerase sigma-54 factor
MQARIGPQHVMASRLLRAGRAEVEQLLLQALCDNPALELVRGLDALAAARLDSDYRLTTGGSRSEARPTDAVSLADRPSALEQLEAQLALLVAPEDLELAQALLLSLDRHGYLRESLETLASRLGIDLPRLQRVVQVLAELDPPGIGAHDLRECLLIQCRHLQQTGIECAVSQHILEAAWDDFANHRWRRVARTLGLALPVVEETARFIARNLYPYPLQMLPEATGPDERLLAPDLVVHRYPGAGQTLYRLELPGEEAFELRLSGAFARALQGRLEPRAELLESELRWVAAQVEQARVYMSAFAQRWITLRRIGEFIVAQQTDFFQHGPRHLQPMTRAAVAQALGMHESTVSRAVSDKILQLPDRHLLPLSTLFDASLPLKEAMRQVLFEAAGPLSDREMAERLKAQGLDVARRTVAKYRGQLNLPNCRKHNGIERPKPWEVSRN